MFYRVLPSNYSGQFFGVCAMSLASKSVLAPNREIERKRARLLERDRERQRETERGIEREIEREIDRDRHVDKRQREIERGIHRYRDIGQS